jgi:hypothetical protein
MHLMGIGFPRISEALTIQQVLTIISQGNATTNVDFAFIQPRHHLFCLLMRQKEDYAC